MAEREIRAGRSIRLGTGKVYKAGDEDKLLEAATPDQLKSLRQRKLISGSWSKKSAEPAQAPAQKQEPQKQEPQKVQASQKQSQK